MREYKIKVTMANSGIMEIKAETEEEAKSKASDMIASGYYHEGFMDDAEFEKYEIVSSKPIDPIRIELMQTYLSTNDCTIIWENTYRGNEMIRERIVGYYHGTPNREDLKKFAFQGVEGILDIDDIYENVKNY